MREQAYILRHSYLADYKVVHVEQLAQLLHRQVTVNAAVCIIARLRYRIQVSLSRPLILGTEDACCVEYIMRPWQSVDELSSSNFEIQH